MLDDFHRKIEEIDPDIVITHDGDNVDIPALIRLAEKSGVKLNISRNGRGSKPRSQERVTWSYGRLLRKEAYHSLEGRLHIDMGRSFIGKEGGIEGLMELSRSLDYQQRTYRDYHRVQQFQLCKFDNRLKMEY